MDRHVYWMVGQPCQAGHDARPVIDRPVSHGGQVEKWKTWKTCVVPHGMLVGYYGELYWYILILYLYASVNDLAS